ncbi:MAG: galactosyltransferase-related protein [Candidatus Paceibacterota bacterium]|jgi:predicted glycosyltransferase involved in capsule biosynthesis
MIDIVIPHSNIDEYRKRNLFFIVKYYKEYLPDSNIIIVEQNTETDINEIKDLIGTHLKLKITEQLFCKSYLLNEGYNGNKNKYVFFIDTDCVVDKNILLSINNLLNILDRKIILPYNKPVFNLDENQTVQFINNHKSFNNFDLNLIRRNCQSNGGVVMISSDNYYKIGGHDPRFIGWGGEDDAFYVKAIKTIGVVRLNSDLFHLNHPKGVNDGTNNPYYNNNYNYYTEYLNKDNNTIINSIGFNHLKK